MRGHTRARIAGSLGLVLIASAPVTLWLGGGPLAWAKLALGGLMAAAGLWARRRAARHDPGRSVAAGARWATLRLADGATAGGVVVLAVAANLAAFAHPRSVDLTREQLYTLSPRTLAVLEGLDARGQDVELLAFYANTEASHPAADALLARYRAASRHVHARIVSPQARPDLVERHQITDQGPRLVALAGGREARAREPSEQDLTAAIVHVAEHAPPRAYVLTGHAEGSADDREHAEGFGQLGDAIAADGYALLPFSFAEARSVPLAPNAPNARVALDAAHAPGAQQARHAQDAAHASAAPSAPVAALAVPDDAALLLVIAPRQPLTPPEARAVGAYLAKGGRTVVLLEPDRASGLEGVLSDWGVRPGDDVIVDTNPLGRLLGLGATAPMAHLAPTDHPIVAPLRMPLVLQTARSLTASPDALPDVTLTALARTGDTAWGETAVTADGTAARDAADHPPPLTVAYAAERPADPAAGADTDADADADATGRLVVVGDADWASNRYVGMQGNRDFALGAVGWAAAQPDKVVIRPPHRPGSQLLLTGSQMAALKVGALDLLPLSFALVGIAVVLTRRQR